MSEFSCVPVCGPFDLGEGPHWNQRNNSLYFVDAFVGDFCKFDEITRQLDKKHFSGVVTIVIPWEGNYDKFLVSKEKELLQLDWNTGNLKRIASIEKEAPKTIFNDGKCDRKNRLWIGTIDEETNSMSPKPDLGSLYSMNNKYEIKQKVENISISNGLTWSLDNQHFFFVDSGKRKVFVFDFDENSGDVFNQRVFFDFETHCKPNEYPDGMTIDASGKIWIACFNGGRVLRIDPETSIILSSVNFENTSNITSLCFGGSEMNKLFVTSGYHGLNDDRRKVEPNAGYLFEVTFERENIKGLFGECFINDYR